MAPGHNEYVPGYKPPQVQNHEWRTAENSAAHLLPTLESKRVSDPKLSLLDVGTGSGTIAQSLATLIPEGTVIATDLSETILERARELAAGTAAKNLTFQRASAYELPFADNSFDVVHTSQMLCHMDAPVDALREMLRVTKPGGVVSAREADLSTSCYWPDVGGLRDFHRVWLEIHEASGGSITAGRQLVSWAMKAGAKREQIKASFGTWCYSDLEDRRMWGTFKGLRMLVHIVTGLTKCTTADTMISRIENGGIRTKAISLGLASGGNLAKMADAWREWADYDNGTLGLLHGEVLIFK
ncbi:hypothetical protein K4F52_009706 [Lecanicillium sp. MT-2017a]|nr:hypothetical protein K4F52_009706 [Lecanicillium sp. MT-2017a]